MNGGIDLELLSAPLSGTAGRGVRVAVLDSGIHAEHPHVSGAAIEGGGVVAGCSLSPAGALESDHVDRLGHGTAVAAAILEKAPGAELVAIRIFEQRLAASSEILALAIRRAIGYGARILNLSLGTRRAEQGGSLERAVDDARRAGAWIVSPVESAGHMWMPGGLPGATGVLLDWALPRHTMRIVAGPGESLRAAASGYPRPIPGVPPERNLKGSSFAAANVSGILARSLEAWPDVDSLDELVGVLRASAPGPPPATRPPRRSPPDR